MFRFSRLFQKSLFRHTLWMLVAQGLSLVLQAAYFVMIARALGAEQYGAFVGAMAISAILAPFASFGSGNLLIKNVARNQTLFKDYWGNALFVNVIYGFGLLTLLLAVSPIFLPQTIPLKLIFLVALSDLIFARILNTSGQAFQAVHRLSRTALLTISLSVAKVLAAMTFVSFVIVPDATKWAFFYLCSNVVSAVFGVLLVSCSLGNPRLALFRLKPEMTEGFYFAISSSSQTIYNDIDKTMLASLSSLEATGIYAAAYRLINVAFVPIRSLVYAAYAKFFQQGAVGIRGSLNFAKRLVPIASIYGGITSIVLFSLAPVVPYILGSEYNSAVVALRWLAPLLFLKALQYFAADTLTGAGFQGVRSAIQIGIAIFNVLLNLWLIPLYSWKGAAYSSLASDSLLMLSLWVIVYFFYRREVQSIKLSK